MAQTFFPVTPVEVTPGFPVGHQPVDVSAYVPVGATGVVLHIIAATLRNIGLRKGGSTYDQPYELGADSHVWGMAGLDENRIFECEIGSVGDMAVWLIGYTIAGVTFLDSPTNISLGSTGSAIPIDCSASAPNAIGIIIDVVVRFGVARSYMLRKNGSTDDRVDRQELHNWAIIGCDENQIIEAEIADTDVDFYLVGYVTDGCTFKTNADDFSMGSTGSYAVIDCSTQAPNAGFLFFEVTSLIDQYDYALRKLGESGGYFDIYVKANRHPWAFVECDEDQRVEGKIANTRVEFFLVGYAEGSPLAQLTGVTKDKNGGVLANCECFLCKDNLDNTATFIAHTQSDGSGNYTFDEVQDTDAQYFVISWKDVIPHVFDVTDHVLQPVVP